MPADLPLLLVDDDAEVRAALAEYLTAAGYAVATAPDGAAALDLLGAGLRPVVIVLDLAMPRMDGWTFLEVRRHDPALTAIPVVVLSARAGATRRAPYVGVAAVVAKPADPDDLLAALDAARRR